VNLGRYASLIALIAGAVASGLLVFNSGPGDNDESDTMRLGMGYYVKDAELMGTGEDGQTLYRVSTRMAEQSLEDSSINFKQINMTYSPLKEIPWDLTANTGRIPPDEDIIQLTGDVVAASRVADEPQTIIRTDYLEIDPDTYIAQTEHPVTIEHAGNIVFATGLRAYFKEDRLQLISNVNGKFVQ
jgi:lipopolysaccharide export system protein LptC